MISDILERHRQIVGVFAALMIFWVLLNGTVAPDVLALGAVVALLISVAFKDTLSFFSDFRFTPAAVWATVLYFAYFFKELVVANLKLSAVVLHPALPIKPGLVKVRTNLKTPMGRLLLANSITLTPGTLSVEMDGEWLYVHWVVMETDDVDEATAKIVRGFERFLEVMYG
ncbi:MAG: Na+/H+ antiporter subunit E [Alphaproteobacteria bacterium]|nr:Na+/H+ antiporter subunit E [Alphaproteobacteria bacterium]